MTDERAAGGPGATRPLPPSVDEHLVELMRRAWLTRKEFSSTPQADDPMWDRLEQWWRVEKGLVGDDTTGVPT